MLCMLWGAHLCAHARSADAAVRSSDRVAHARHFRSAVTCVMYGAWLQDHGVPTAKQL